jgi:hypothetical protein
VADLTQDEAIERARAIDVESYDVFLDLTAEPVRSRTEVRFRWLRPGASTFAELRTQGVRLSRLLFPVTLVSEATIEAANAAEPPDDVLRLAVAEQATIMCRRLAARQQR